jgi:hypothetical protein
MFYKAKVAVCSEIRTKHINAMYVKLPLGLKRLKVKQSHYRPVQALRVPGG